MRLLDGRHAHDRQHVLRKLRDAAQGGAGVHCSGRRKCVVAANRTVFEIAVDATLMHLDERSYPPAMLLAWEDSAKLKAALKVRDFYSGKPVPHGHTPLIQFIERDAKRVEALRVKYGPTKNGKGRHPDQWTGHTSAPGHLFQRTPRRGGVPRVPSFVSLRAA